MGRVAIAGGGMCGLAAAMMLADDGHEVTVLERDAGPVPPDPDTAYTSWDRGSVAQFGIAHWMHARGTTIMQRHLPVAYGLLADHGGYRFNLVRYLLAVQGQPTVPEDDRFDVLTGRRAALEWAMATAADQHPGVTVRRGVGIAGFSLGASVLDGVPHVDGLRLATGETVAADLVIDATGRRSSTPDWLRAVGAAAPTEVAEDSGFAYYGRYYRGADGALPGIIAPLLSPIGSMSLLTLPADNGTWAVTLYGLAEDRPLRRFREPEVFERVVRACPLHAHWIDAEPIAELRSMVGVVDRHRRFVVDGRPCATGVLTLGDAASCTNPSLGRGITLGLVHAEILREVVAAHAADPVALALAFDERTEAELQPWHDATTAMDRRRVVEMRAFAEGRTPEPDPAGAIGELLGAAVTTDPTATRVFGEVFGCLATVEEIFARPGVLRHVLSLRDRVTPQPVPGPDRAELLALVGAA